MTAEGTAGGGRRRERRDGAERRFGEVWGETESIVFVFGRPAVLDVKVWRNF